MRLGWSVRFLVFIFKDLCFKACTNTDFGINKTPFVPLISLQTVGDKHIMAENVRSPRMPEERPAQGGVV